MSVSTAHVGLPHMDNSLSLGSRCDLSNSIEESEEITMTVEEGSRTTNTTTPCEAAGINSASSCKNTRVSYTGTSRDSSTLSQCQGTTDQSACHNGTTLVSPGTQKDEVNEDDTNFIQLGGETESTTCCFFPGNGVLRGTVPKKVVRYAQKRMNKTKFSPCERARKMTLVSHDQLVLGELLGEGSFSSVYSVESIDVDTDTNPLSIEMPDVEEIVVKVLRPKLLKNPPLLAACAADIVKEGRLLARLQHENIISIHGWAPNGVEAFMSGRHDATFLILGKLETTLSTKLSTWRKQKEQLSGNIVTHFFLRASKTRNLTKLHSFEERMDVMDGLVNALTYLHSQDYIHRDLKPDNIGFDSQGILKIFDFDVARILPSKFKRNSSMCYQMTKRVGSPRYMSPECARGDPYNAKSDVYAVALLLHELYSLEKPYDDIPSELHDDMVFYGSARPPLPPKWPPLLKVALQEAWNERISTRPTMRGFHAIWTLKLKPTVLEEKRKRYARGTVQNNKSQSKDTGSATTVGSSSRDSFIIKEISPHSVVSFWDSTRTSPDSCHESNDFVP